METYKKSERLCNFTYKEMLFKEGKSFFSYPFRVYYLVLEKNLEPLFYDDPLVFQGDPVTAVHKEQNPSWPHRQLSLNAFFHFPAKSLIGVPKKNFKKAVDRNHLKRIVKEAYRKNKMPFYTFLENRDVFCLLGLVYTVKSMIPYHEAESKIIVTLQKVCEAIDSDSRQKKQELQG